MIVQPDLPMYPPSELNSFKTYNRDTYRKEMGKQAPPWDPKRPIQRWFDPAAAKLPGDDLYIIQYWDLRPSGPTMKRTAILNEQAAVPNLPGKYEYPAYVVPSSGAYMDILDSLGKPTGEKRYLDAEILSTRADVDALVAMLKGVVEVLGVVQQQNSEPYQYKYEPWEERRVWSLHIKHGSSVNVVNVGRLLKDMYRDGVGAPGHWTFGSLLLKWVSEVPVDNGERETKEIPVPQRDLLPNERWNLSNPFSGPMVERTDKGETVQQDNQRLMADRVAEILQLVRGIYDKLNQG